jgi:TonB family protein
MKKIILGLLILLSVSVAAQQKKTSVAKKPDTQSALPQAEQFGFTAEKKSPRYNGGREAMSKFIYSKMQYPQDAKEKNLEGDVELQFYIDVDGNVQNVTVVKGVCKSIDDEAIRVVKSMPKWIPGQNGNVKVIMKTSLIIGFHLNN